MFRNCWSDKKVTNWMKMWKNTKLYTRECMPISYVLWNKVKERSKKWVSYSNDVLTRYNAEKEARRILQIASLDERLGEAKKKRTELKEEAKEKMVTSNRMIWKKFRKTTIVWSTNHCVCVIKNCIYLRQ